MGIRLFTRILIVPVVMTGLIFAQQSLGANPGGSAEENQQSLPWLQWDTATGDWWRNRPLISDQGVSVTATYTGQVWGNVAGGLERNAVYMGLLEFGMDIDFEKLIGWKGGSFNTTWGWTSGDQITEPFLGANYGISGIEASAGLRAFTLWLQQTLFDEKLTLRAGMFAADQDFTISEYSSLFLNSGFGWPILYEGSKTGFPAYPYSSPGLYVAVRPYEGWVWQAAVLQADVEPKDANFYWHFDRMDGLLFINEASYSWSKASLPGTLKLGAMFNTGYTDSPDGSGDESWGGGFYYGVLDQALYVESGSTNEVPQGLGWFARGGFAGPQRFSPLGMLLQTGFACAGPIPGRDHDSAGIAFSWGQSSPRRASSLEGGNRGLEMIFEATYQIRITPCCSVQPDLQYIVQPGGSTAIPNALVLGVSVAVDF